MSRAIAVTSGKGGTGKTSLTGGVASCLAALGNSVLCIDMDIGLRNLDLALGMTDRVLMDFTDVIGGRCTLQRAAARHPVIENLSLLTAPLSLSPGVTEEGMRDLLREAKAQYDYVLMDSPAGLGLGFRLAMCGADRAIVVSTTDASALRDAQRVVAELSRSLNHLHLVMNKVRPKLLKQLHTTIDDAMDAAGLPLLGVVPDDEQVILAANLGKPLILTSRRGAAVAYLNIARRLTGERVPLMRLH